VLEAVQLFRYREKMGLTYYEALKEPYEEIERAFLIWELDNVRAKLKKEN
jgi:hypothetical protein